MKEGYAAVKRSKNRTAGPTPYHTKECDFVPDDPRYMPIGICEAWDSFELCKYCDDNVDYAEHASGEQWNMSTNK